MKYTTEQKNNVITMYKSGAPREEISRQTKVSLSTINTEIYKFRKFGENVPASRKPGAGRPCKVMTLEVKEAAASMFRAGMSCTKVAKAMGIRQCNIDLYHKVFIRDNPGFENPSLKKMDERDREICEMRKSGMTYAEIGRRTNMSAENARRICGLYGISASAKRARRNSGEIPSELLQPVLDWLTKNAAKDAAEKMREFAESLSA